MGSPTLLVLFVIAVLPCIQGTTPEYFRSMGQPMGIGGDPAGGGIYPNDDYTGGQSQGYGSSYGSSSVLNRKIHTEIYDKKDDFSFPIFNSHFLDCDVPLAPSYGTSYISQLVRHARVCCHVFDFNEHNLCITGRIWCTCRRRCRYREWTVRYSCLLPFYPRYWNSCCKYLRNYQTSSMYRGYGVSPYSQYPTYPTYPGSGGQRLPPKGV